MTDIAKNLASVKARISATADEANRLTEDITLVAVSKTFPADHIVPALDAGHRVFGENRVQEAEEKWPGLREKYGPLELHLIGPLQRNKAKSAVALFDVIETVDRMKLANTLAREIKDQGRDVTCLIQVNTGAEPQKAGILPDEADDFIRSCVQDLSLPVSGLMCIPPVDEEPSLHFALLREIAKRHDLKTLSMGMSADFEAAIPFGATHVRVGSAIFGARTKAV